MNFLYKKFWLMKDLLKFVNDNRIDRFGVVSNEENFFGGYILIYKK